MTGPLYSIDARGMVNQRATTPEEDRAFFIHMARVHIAEARRRRHQPAFARSMLAWAATSRRRAAGIRPAQGDLFGVAQTQEKRDD